MSNLFQYTFYVYITRIEEIERFCTVKETVTPTFENFNIENFQLRNEGMPKMNNKWDDLCTTGPLESPWNGYDDWGKNYWPMDFVPDLPYTGTQNSANFKTIMNIDTDLMPLIESNIDQSKQFVTYRSMEVEATNMKYVAPTTGNYPSSTRIKYNPDFSKEAWNPWNDIVDRKIRTSYNPESSVTRPVINCDCPLAYYTWNGSEYAGVAILGAACDKGNNCGYQDQLNGGWGVWSVNKTGWTDSRPDMKLYEVNTYKTYGIGCRYFFTPLYSVFNTDINKLRNYIPNYEFKYNPLPLHNYGCYKGNSNDCFSYCENKPICGSRYLKTKYENSPYGANVDGEVPPEQYSPDNPDIWDGQLPFFTYNNPTSNVIAARPNRISSGNSCDVNIKNFLCTDVNDKNGDILYQSTVKVKIPIHELVPYTRPPTVQDGEYVNPFTSYDSFYYGYYDYGFFSNPDVLLIASEMEDGSNTELPSALYSIQYTLTEADFLRDGFLPQLIDVLNFYNTIYAFTNPMFGIPYWTTTNISDTGTIPPYEVDSIDYRTFNSQSASDMPSYMNSIGSEEIMQPLYTVYSNLDNVENNFHRYYETSLDSASRLISDYCTYSNNMLIDVCSGENINFQYLNINGSPCVGDYSNCDIGWTKFCTEPQNYNTQACLQYFKSGYGEDGTMSNDMQQELRTVCGKVYESSDPKDLEESEFYDICGCYLPNDVYEEYLKEINVTGQSVGSAQCWFMPCTQSSFTITNPLYLECPDTSVATCLQKSYVDLQTIDGDIKNNTIVVNQVIKECTAQISKDPIVTDEPTQTPTNYDFQDISIAPADFTSPTQQKTPFYPVGFSYMVIVSFLILLVCILIFV